MNLDPKTVCRKNAITLIIIKGANDFNNAMRAAAEGGHKDIIDLMVQKGANDFNNAIFWASKKR